MYNNYSLLSFYYLSILILISLAFIFTFTYISLDLIDILLHFVLPSLALELVRLWPMWFQKLRRQPKTFISLTRSFMLPMTLVSARLTQGIITATTTNVAWLRFFFFVSFFVIWRTLCKIWQRQTSKAHKNLNEIKKEMSNCCAFWIEGNLKSFDALLGERERKMGGNCFTYFVIVIDSYIHQHTHTHKYINHQVLVHCSRKYYFFCIFWQFLSRSTWEVFS